MKYFDKIEFSDINGGPYYEGRFFVFLRQGEIVYVSKEYCFSLSLDKKQKKKLRRLCQKRKFDVYNEIGVYEKYKSETYAEIRFDGAYVIFDAWDACHKEITGCVGEADDYHLPANKAYKYIKNIVFESIQDSKNTKERK